MLQSRKDHSSNELEEEKDRLMELIEWADVLVENFKPNA